MVPSSLSGIILTCDLHSVSRIVRVSRICVSRIVLVGLLVELC